MVISRGMIMAEDNGNAKDLKGGEDEELLDFDFGEDLFGEEEEVKHRESVQEEEIIDLVDVAEEGRAPESVGEDIEGLEELLADEEEEVPKEVQHASRVDTVPIKKMEETFFAEEPEPSIDLEKEIDLDEALEELKELVSEEDIGKLKEPLLEEVIEKDVRYKEEAIKEEAPLISEEKIEALITKVVSDVLERVAREVIPEVAEKIVREEIDVLKRSIMPEE